MRIINMNYKPSVYIEAIHLYYAMALRPMWRGRGERGAIYVTRSLLVNHTDEFQSIKKCIVITLSPELVP